MYNSLCRNFLEDLNEFLIKKSQPPFALHEPYINPEIEHEVIQCIRSGWVSSVGFYVNEFEKNIQALTKSPYVSLTNTGTSALHLALHLLDVGKDDEVLLPSLTFVATGNAVLYRNATPHFIDVEKKSATLCPNALRSFFCTQTIQNIRGQRQNIHTGRPIKAIITMHAFGHSASSEIYEVAKEYGVAVIEDAAEALGSYDERGRHLGTIADIGIISFNGNKTVTTGGGGAILTANEDLACRARHLLNTAKTPHPWEFYHDEIGYNYRMPALNAAFGVGQLKAINKILRSKRKLAEDYIRTFNDHPLGYILKEPKGCRSNYWLNTFILNDEFNEDDLKKIIRDAHDMSIYLRPAWTPLHTLPAFQTALKQSLDNTKFLRKRILNLPSSPSLSMLET